MWPGRSGSCAIAREHNHPVRVEIVRMSRYALAFAAVAVLLAARALPAQMNLRTVGGMVRDTAGQPIDQVQVLAMTAGRKTLTGADGRFQIDSLEQGEERLLFRRLGFNPVEVTIFVDSAGAEVTARLTPVAQELKPIVIRGRRSGVRRSCITAGAVQRRKLRLYSPRGARRAPGVAAGSRLAARVVRNGKRLRTGRAAPLHHLYRRAKRGGVATFGDRGR